MKSRSALALTLWLVLVLLMSTSPQLPAQANIQPQQRATGSIELTLELPRYSISEEQGSHVIDVEGFSTLSMPEHPMLPHRLYDVAVPPDAVLDSLELEIVDSISEVLPGVYHIEVAPLDLPGEPGKTFAVGRVEAQGPGEQFPSACVKLLSYSQMRKWKFVRLDFTPFQYDVQSGELTVTSSVTLRIDYATSGAEADGALLRDTVMDDVAAEMFINHDTARSWYVAEEGEVPGTTYDYVIITTNAIETNSTKLGTFITHKQAQGHSVLVVTEADFGGLTGQAPNNKAEKIRQWLKNNYTTYGIEYVLLIGDPHPYESGEGDIPMKMCWPRRGEGSDEDSPTDYFYADLTGNWDYDGDLYYGEWSDDFGVGGGVDFTPELYVGRIPVYSAQYSTLDNILQKTMDYENEGGSLAWRKSILLPMSFSTQTYDGAPLAEQMRDDYLNGALYSSWRQYQQGNGACGLNSTYPSEQELRGGTVVRDRWAANDYGIVCWWGHGSPTSASVGCEDCWDGTLFQSSYASSLDDDHPSFTYQCSCTNGYPENSDNLQYAILKNGGIGTVSATRVSWFNTGVGYGDFDGSTTNSGIGYEYVKRLVEEKPAAEALYLAKSSMTPGGNTRLMNFYDFNLYGDPAVGIAIGGGTEYEIFLPLVMKNYGAVAGWVTIVSEDFEGAFPGPWIVDDNEPGYGQYCWGKRNCRPYQGSYSGWGVGGCADGTSLACGSDYPNYTEGWMIYGPFSLADATAADLQFKLWLNTELHYDGVCRFASTNGTTFYGWCSSGDSGGWEDKTLDLSDVPTLGNLLGQSQVWIALVFDSDYIWNYPEGGYVDNIVLRKFVSADGSPPPGPSGPESVPADAQIADIPSMMILEP